MDGVIHPLFTFRRFYELVYLGQFAYEVLEPLGIEYRTKRTGKSRLIKFLRRDGDDANDAGIAI